MVQPHIPDWVKHAVFYQIFADRFARSDRVAKPRNLEPWDAPPTVHGYKGGDLLGVVEHLDYLQDLGINALYFTPIFQSASNHRYHTHDYYQIDPLLGGMEAFRELRAATASRGMKIVLDGVFNHASRGCFYFNDILENGAASPWIDWFTVLDWPLHPYSATQPANYQTWAGLPALPRWNTENPQVREYIMRVAEYWLREGIDGWRLDVPFEITSAGFWHEFRQRCKAINPDCYIIGEIWWDSRSYLRGDQFDAVMNYLFTKPVIQFTGQDHIVYDLVRSTSIDPYPGIDARHFADNIDQLLGIYAWETQLGQFNLLGSHDTARFRSIVGGDESAMHLATLFLLTYPGAPCIYYGDEVGLVGGRDPGSRGSFPWDHPESWQQDALDYHRRLIQLRHQHPALRTGTYHRLYPSIDQDEAAHCVYAFQRHLVTEQGEDCLVVALNSSRQEQRIAVPIDQMPGTGATVLYGESSAMRRAGDFCELTLPPRAALMIGGCSAVKEADDE